MRYSWLPEEGVINSLGEGGRLPSLMEMMSELGFRESVCQIDQREFLTSGKMGVET